MPRTFPTPSDFGTILLGLINGAATQFGGTIVATRRDDEIQVTIHTDATGSSPGLRRSFKVTVS